MQASMIVSWWSNSRTVRIGPTSLSPVPQSSIILAYHVPLNRICGVFNGQLFIRPDLKVMVNGLAMDLPQMLQLGR